MKHVCLLFASWTVLRWSWHLIHLGSVFISVHNCIWDIISIIMVCSCYVPFKNLIIDEFTVFFFFCVKNVSFIRHLGVAVGRIVLELLTHKQYFVHSW